MTMLRWSILALTLGTAGATVSAPAVRLSAEAAKPAPPGDIKQPESAIVQGLFEPLVAHKKGLGIVVGVVDREGGRLYAFGEVAKDGRGPDGETLFELGSVTKVFTGLIFADAVERGLLSPEDPASKYLPHGQRVPEFQGRPILLKHLATHTSGLPRYPDSVDPSDPYAESTNERLYAFLSRFELQRAPGEKPEYSSLGLGLLGHLLERRVETDYDTMLRGLASSLAMKRTSARVPDEHRLKQAQGTLDGAPARRWKFAGLHGAGAAWSCAQDMILFLQANLGLARTPLADAIRRAQDERYGWQVKPVGPRRILWQNGSTKGFHAVVALDRGKKIGLVMLANGGMLWDADKAAVELLDRLLR